MTCLHCRRPLKEAQFREDKAYKSCPNCSKANGEYHVFYANPQAFGTTQRRATSVNPEGPQSHCTDCRSGQNPHSYTAILCDSL